MLRKSVAALLAVGCCHSVFAEELRQVNNDAHKIFVSADFAKVKHELGIDGYDDEVDEDSTSYSLSVGFWLSDNIGLAVGYVDFGDAELSDLDYDDGYIREEHSLEGDGFTVSAILSTPAWQNPWRFYAELGLFKADYAWNAKGQVGSFSFNENVAESDDVNIWGGIGAAFDFTDQLEATLALDWYTLEPDMTELGKVVYEEGQADVQLTRFSLGLNYAF